MGVSKDEFPKDLKTIIPLSTDYQFNIIFETFFQIQSIKSEIDVTETESENLINQVSS